MFLLNTLIGFLISQILDVLARNRATPSSPFRFSFAFFWKDSWRKIVVSLSLSLTLSTAVFLNWSDVSSLLGFKDSHEQFIYMGLGTMPENILQVLKRRFGLLQPPSVSGFKRDQ